MLCFAAVLPSRALPGKKVEPAGEKPPPEPESVPDEPVGRYPCPCCGYLTLPVPREEAVAYIHSFQWQRHAPGLDRIRTLLHALGGVGYED